MLIQPSLMTFRLKTRWPMSSPYFRQTTRLPDGKVVTLDEFRAWAAMQPPPTAEEIVAIEAGNRMAEAYAPRHVHPYSKWHFNIRRAI